MQIDTPIGGSAPATIEQGLALHRAGDVAGAIGIYRALLEHDPLDAGAMHLLGVAEDAEGRTENAIDLLTQAVALRPSPIGLANFAAILVRAGRLTEALAASGRAIALNPDNADAYSNLGVALMQQGNDEEALLAFRRASSIDADQFDALVNQAEVLRKLGCPAEAVRPLEQAVALAPERVDLVSQLAEVLRLAGRHDEAVLRWRNAVALEAGSLALRNNLAATLGEADRPQESLLVLQEVLEHFPDFAAARANMAQALLGVRRFAEAETLARAAMALQPDAIDARINLGLALRGQRRLDEAAQTFREVLDLSVTVDTCANLAVTQHELGLLEETAATLDRGLALAPDNAEMTHHKALTLLEMGRWAEGWALYDSRFGTTQARKQRANLMPSLWTGEDIAGEVLLLRAEQGLGDTIQFARFIPQVAQHAGRVLLDAPLTLHRLLGRMPGIEILPPGGHQVFYQMQCPLLSLPRALGTTLETIPAEVPYLSVPDEAVTAWRARLGAVKQRRVAIVWAGNPLHPNDFRRSIRFPELLPLFEVPDIAWYSLQLGDIVADLAQAPPERMTDLSALLTDMAETAAALTHMDLVIAPDTSVAHLAGALGCPVWLLVPFAPDWRWMRGREDTPWYPTMRLWRQDRTGDWAGVIERVAKALVLS
jgi:tetratricopeptide (TPR) repeat protein